MQYIIITFFIILLLLTGCGGPAERDKVVRLARDPQLGRVLIDWVDSKIVGNRDLEAQSFPTFAEGPGEYFLKNHDFDWAAIRFKPELCHIKIIGDIRNPDAVYFGLGQVPSVVVFLPGKELKVNDPLIIERNGRIGLYSRDKYIVPK